MSREAGGVREGRLGNNVLPEALVESQCLRKQISGITRVEDPACTAARCALHS